MKKIFPLSAVAAAIVCVITSSSFRAANKTTTGYWFSSILVGVPNGESLTSADIDFSDWETTAPGDCEGGADYCAVAFSADQLNFDGSAPVSLVHFSEVPIAYESLNP